LLLAHLCDQTDDVFRYLVVPTDVRTIEALLQGKLPTRDALRQPLTWVVEVGVDEAINAVWRVDPAELPEDCWPLPGAFLRPAVASLPTAKLDGFDPRP
jgi:hypothetical protein